MSEMKLDQLFQKAREEAPTTSLQQVQKWIGYSAVLLLMIGLLGKFKVFTLKVNAMYASIIGAVVLSAIALVYSNSSTDVVDEHQPIQKSQTIYPTDSLGGEPDLELIEPIEPIKQTQEASIQPFLMPFLPMNQWELIPSQLSPTLIPIELKSTKMQEQGAFNTIVAKGMFTLVIEEGEVSGYRAEGDYNPESLVVELDEAKHQLTVSYNFKSGKQKKRGKQTVIDDTNIDNLTFYVSVKELKKLTIGGIVNVKYTSKSEINYLDADVSGMSVFNVHADVTELSTRVSGQSSFKLNGKVTTLKADVSGMSHLEVNQVEKNGSCVVNCSGMGMMKTNLVDAHLEMNTSGTSIVHLKGTAKITELTLSGASIIKAKDLTTEVLKAKLSGTSELTIQCTTDAEVRASGASVVKLGGSAFRSIEESTGAAKIKRF